MKSLNKKVLVVMMAAVFLLAPMVPVAQAAATVTGGFNVTVTLTPACTVTAPSNVVFTYTSFQVAVANSTGGAFTLSCSTNLPYALTLDNPLPSNTVIGLVYALTLPANGNGTGAGQALTITGTMAGGQGGTCAGPSGSTCPGTQARVLTVTY